MSSTALFAIFCITGAPTGNGRDECTAENGRNGGPIRAVHTSGSEWKASMLQERVRVDVLSATEIQNREGVKIIPRTSKSRRPPTNDYECTSDLLGGCLPRLVQPDLPQTQKIIK
jgi:hypothetical protein